MTHVGRGVRTNASIDRIIPSLGYIPGNVCFCCAIVNRMKLDMPVDIFFMWAERITDARAIYKNEKAV